MNSSSNSHQATFEISRKNSNISKYDKYFALPDGLSSNTIRTNNNIRPSSSDIRLSSSYRKPLKK